MFHYQLLSFGTMLSSVHNGNSGFLKRPVIGNAAPDFIAFDQNGARVSLVDFKKRRVLLVFADSYSEFESNKANFQFLDEKFQELNLVILVASTHKNNFFHKGDINNLKFISHNDLKIFHAYGVISESTISHFGRSKLDNITFLIDEQHKIEKVFENRNLIPTISDENFK